MTLNQIAGEFGISHQAVQKWDKGANIPFDKLQVLAKIGFDVQYIILGVRSKNLSQITEIPVEIEPDDITARINQLTETQTDVIKAMIGELERANKNDSLGKDLAKIVKKNGS